MSLSSNKKWRFEWTALLTKKDRDTQRPCQHSELQYITLVQVSCQKHHYCVDL